MQFKNFDEIFEAFNNMKALVIGDVMIDSYLWGKVDRISPEAPVPIVNVTKTEKRLGGAANVAMNVQALGAKAVLCSVVGNDSEAEDFMRLMDEGGFPSEGIIKSNARKTTVKHRIVSGSQQLLRVDNEDDHQLSEVDNVNFIKKVKTLIDDANVVIFEDYDKGVLDADNIEKIIAYASSKNVPVVVDPKKRNFLAYKNVDLFKPNLKELKEGLGIKCDPSKIDDLRQAVKRLGEKLNQKLALITLSEYGAYINKKDGSEKHVPAHHRSIADVSGAGDTVISVAALCLALDLPIENIVEVSNLAGGLVCEYLGVVPINKEELLKETKEKVKFPS